ncbi:MAG: molybdopterin cofactor-binding domain-containing protein, partial [Burkholderiaceae bacterium]
MAYVMAKAGNDGNDGGAVRLPGSLQVNRRLDRWLRVAEDGCIEIFSGKVELGQGILTALAQIAAEELDLRLDQVRMVAATTASSPNEAVTSGSLSIQESGAALRQACAEARRLWHDAAAVALGVEAGSLHAVEGRFIAADGRSVTYRQIADPKMLAREASGDACAKDASQYRAVGAAVPRIDLPDKVFGRPRFIHDLEFPGMLHGAVLRPPTLSSTLLSLPDVPMPMPMHGAQTVRDGSLIGVLAATRRDA